MISNNPRQTEAVLDLARDLATRVLSGTHAKGLPHQTHSFAQRATGKKPKKSKTGQLDDAAIAIILDKAMRGAEDQFTRCAAAYALHVRDPERTGDVVDQLVRELMINMSLRLRIPAKLLVCIGEPAVPHLVCSLDRSMVPMVLGMLGQKAAAAVPALIKRMGDDDLDVACTLARICTPEATAAALPVLLKGLEDPFFHWRKRALAGLALLGGAARSWASQVRPLLKDDHLDNRCYAVTTLIALDDVDAAIAGAIDLIGNSEIHIRYHVIDALGALGPRASAAVPALLALLGAMSDPATGDRARAAHALRRIAPSDPAVAAALAAAAFEPALRKTMALSKD